MGLSNLSGLSISGYNLGRVGWVGWVGFGPTSKQTNKQTNQQTNKQIIAKERGRRCPRKVAMLTIKTAPWILLVGDLLAILLFVFVGQTEHSTVDAANPLVGLLRTAWPFLLAWVVVAGLTRAIPFQAEGMRLPLLLGRALNAWFIAAPLALMLRGFMLGRLIPPIFMLVTLGLGGAFVLVWRGVFGWLWRRMVQSK
jgi:hypothetical protein